MNNEKVVFFVVVSSTGGNAVVKVRRRIEIENVTWNRPSGAATEEVPPGAVIATPFDWRVPLAGPRIFRRTRESSGRFLFQTRPDHFAPPLHAAFPAPEMIRLRLILIIAGMTPGRFDLQVIPASLRNEAHGRFGLGHSRICGVTKKSFHIEDE